MIMAVRISLLVFACVIATSYPMRRMMNSDDLAQWINGMDMEKYSAQHIDKHFDLQTKDVEFNHQKNWFPHGRNRPNANGLHHFLLNTHVDPRYFYHYISQNQKLYRPGFAARIKNPYRFRRPCYRNVTKDCVTIKFQDKISFGMKKVKRLLIKTHSSKRDVH